jgi:hypothetical protein
MRSLLFLLLLFSCQPSPDVLPDAQYFPLQTGQYRTYAVTEQRYQPGMTPTVRQYNLRETVGLPFSSLVGETAYPITYAHQTDGGSLWLTDSIGMARMTEAEALLTTGSQTVVKLALPLFEGQRWNGNRYNERGNDEFRVQQAHEPFRMGNQTFDRTLTVVQQNDSTLVGQDKRLEVYAYGVGLIYAERQQLRFCTNPGGCGGTAGIAYGIRQFKRLTEYGNQ